MFDRVKFPIFAFALLSVAFVGTARSSEPPPTYKECGFVASKWLPEGAPTGMNKSYIGVTPVPEGWTVVGGNMGTVPAVLVCR